MFSNFVISNLCKIICIMFKQITSFLCCLNGFDHFLFEKALFLKLIFFKELNIEEEDSYLMVQSKCAALMNPISFY